MVLVSQPLQIISSKAISSALLTNLKTPMNRFVEKYMCLYLKILGIRIVRRMESFASEKNSCFYHPRRLTASLVLTKFKVSSGNKILAKLYVPYRDGRGLLGRFRYWRVHALIFSPCEIPFSVWYCYSELASKCWSLEAQLEIVSASFCYWPQHQDWFQLACLRSCCIPWPPRKRKSSYQIAFTSLWISDFTFSRDASCWGRSIQGSWALSSWS